MLEHMLTSTALAHTAHLTTHQLCDVPLVSDWINRVRVSNIRAQENRVAPNKGQHKEQERSCGTLAVNLGTEKRALSWPHMLEQQTGHSDTVRVD